MEEAAAEIELARKITVLLLKGWRITSTGELMFFSWYLARVENLKNHSIETLQKWVGDR